MSEKLAKIKNVGNLSHPVVTIVMDGVGIAPQNEGNAIYRANMPTLNRLLKDYPNIKIKAHGTAVGLPSDDDMGNSEVGHNALGSGQVFAQGAKLVSNSISEGKMFSSQTWHDLLNFCSSGTLHFIGLFSDGNVHSHINHLKAMIERAKANGIKCVRLHILLDGRDVGEVSALDYVEPFEKFLSSVCDKNFNVKIASGGGRMTITMDRYEANWSMVELGWKTHVLGLGRQFANAKTAIETYRKEANVIDQDLPPFVISESGEPVGKIVDGDSVVFFNFRGDRAIEISKAFEGGADFTMFDRQIVPKVYYAGMLEYDGDLHIPSHFLVTPPEISNTMGQFLVSEGIRQFAVSETQKFGHVTYFWNGNRSSKFSEKFETYLEIKSDIVPFEQRPWMKCAEITDALIEAVKSGKYDFIRCNFPNGDMVGHTGNINATIVSLEAMDLQLARILKVIDSVGGLAIITADHGNADEMFELDKKTGEPKVGKAKTSHTLNAVPFIIYDNSSANKYTLKGGEFGLSNVAATTLNLLGFEKPSMWDDSMIEFK